MTLVAQLMRRLSTVFSKRSQGRGSRRNDKRRKSASAPHPVAALESATPAPLPAPTTGSASAASVPSAQVSTTNEVLPDVIPQPAPAAEPRLQGAAEYLVCKDSGVVVGSTEPERPNWIQLVAGSCQSPVQLERIAFHNGTILGSVSVANLAYEKRVYVRWSLNGVWYNDTMCKYESSNFCTMRDYFSFDLPATDPVQFHLKYTVAGQTYCDNNHGEDYVILLS